jgi:hypothetical protein
MKPAPAQIEYLKAARAYGEPFFCLGTPGDRTVGFLCEVGGWIRKETPDHPYRITPAGLAILAESENVT